MANLKDTAKAYVPMKTKNISEMEIVNLETLNVEVREGINQNDNKPYSFSVVIFNGEDYRVPDTVLKDIKTILEAKPNLKTVKVIKKGQGMGTSYTVIPLD